MHACRTRRADCARTRYGTARHGTSSSSGTLEFQDSQRVGDRRQTKKKKGGSCQRCSGGVEVACPSLARPWHGASRRGVRGVTWRDVTWRFHQLPRQTACTWAWGLHCLITDTLTIILLKTGTLSWESRWLGKKNLPVHWRPLDEHWGYWMVVEPSVVDNSAIAREYEFFENVKRLILYFVIYNSLYIYIYIYRNGHGINWYLHNGMTSPKYDDGISKQRMKLSHISINKILVISNIRETSVRSSKTKQHSLFYG